MLLPRRVVLRVSKRVVVPLQKRLRRSQHARKETEFLRLKRTRLGLEDFESLKVIGRGAFGEVSTKSPPGSDRVDECGFLSTVALVGCGSAGASGAEEGHGPRLRHEDPPQGRHAGEGAGEVLAFEGLRFCSHGYK